MLLFFVDINECASNPCQNDAKCNNLENEYSCNCTDGYSGTNCEKGNPYYFYQHLYRFILIFINALFISSIYPLCVHCFMCMNLHNVT